MKRVLNTLSVRLLGLYHKCIYGSWGTTSYMRKPMRIIGAKHIFIGNNVLIWDGLRMEAIQKWREKEYFPTIKINDNVSIGQNSHITCANKVTIGQGCSILPNVLITDIEHVYMKNKSLAETDIKVGSVNIGNYVTIGMGARILGQRNIVIGDNCIIGTNAVVTKSVPENCIVAGIPAKIIGENREEKNVE